MFFWLAVANWVLTCHLHGVIWVLHYCDINKVASRIINEIEDTVKERQLFYGVMVGSIMSYRGWFPAHFLKESFEMS